MMANDDNTTSVTKFEKDILIMTGTSTLTYVIGLAIFALKRYLCCPQPRSDSDEESLQNLIRSRQMKWLPRKSGELLSGKPLLGKLFIIIRSTLYTICAIIYLFNIYKYHGLFYIPIHHQPQYVVELVANSVFLVSFLLRVTASKNLLSTWLSWETVINHYTIIPVILELFLKTYQFHLGFVYFTGMIHLVDTLVLLNLVNGERSIRKLKLVSKLMITWLTLAGVILLLERIGDFWEFKSTPQYMSYFDCVYFLLVTISTVGYGDIVCKSQLGRFVIIVVIIAALISVTTHLSELYELFHTSRQYTGSFNNEHHPRHVVVCGAINFQSASDFLNVFVKTDHGRMDNNTMIVFMSEQSPDLRLKTLLKRESLHATYLCGDATSPTDLQRAKVRAAEAVIILSDWNCADPATNDWENIMRVVSVKNLYPKCRILVVLTMMENKACMSNIPCWRQERLAQHDRAICISQLKLGLLSVSCVAPGISTLLTNLAVKVTLPMNLDNKKFPQWIRNYYQGTRYGLYTVRFSPSFEGMDFQAVVAIAMKELRVVVLAVQLFSESGCAEQLLINPGSRLKLKPSYMRAIVIAENFIHAQHLRAYCLACGIEKLGGKINQVHSCKLRLVNGDSSSYKKPVEENPMNYSQHLSSTLRLNMKNWAHLFGKKHRLRRNSPIGMDPSDIFNRPFDEMSRSTTGKHVASIDIMRDSTGLFYWVADKEFPSACLSTADLDHSTFCDHILVCLTKQKAGHKMGLANFVMPLRSTRIPMDELKTIVFLGATDLIQTEWYSLKNFPQVYVFSGSPLSRASLRKAGVETCSMCVVLSCSDERPEELSLLADKESIMCSLNVRRILAEMNENGKGEHTHKQAMVITALSNMESASLLSVTNEYKSRNGSVCFSPHYAAGSMFASPLLNGLAPQVFFDATVLTFFETVLHGGPSTEVEKVFAEDTGFVPGLKGQTVTSIPFPGFEINPEGSHVNPNPSPYKMSNDVSSNSSLFESDEDQSIKASNPQLIMTVPEERILVPTKSNPIFTVTNLDGSTQRRVFDRHQSCTTDLPSSEAQQMNVLNAWSSNTVSTVDENHWTRMRKKLLRNWRPLSTTSFLSFTTKTGSSVKMQLSRLRLLPLSAFGVQSINLTERGSLRFGELFENVLNETGTICIGLYRCVDPVLEEDRYSEECDLNNVFNQIGRYVYTLPDSDTPIFQDDLVYCFTAVSEVGR